MSEIQARKLAHLERSSADVESQRSTLLSDVHLVHEALPESRGTKSTRPAARPPAAGADRDLSGMTGAAEARRKSRRDRRAGASRWASDRSARWSHHLADRIASAKPRPTCCSSLSNCRAAGARGGTERVVALVRQIGADAVLDTSAPIWRTSATTRSGPASRACTAPRLAKSSTSGAASRTRYESARVGSCSIARCEPTPIARPTFCAAVASARFTSRASGAPPVMPEITIGASRRRPSSSTDVSTSCHAQLRQRLVHQVHVGEQRRAVRLDVALDAELEMRELAALDLAHARAPARAPRKAPAAIARRRGFERRSDGAEAREAARVEFVEQRAVDAAHGLGWPQDVAILGGEQACRGLIANPRALGVERQQQPDLLGHLAVAQARGMHVHALEVFARQVDAAGLGVLADVAQHVGELHRDPHLAGVLERVGAARFQHAHQQQADRRRDAVAVALEVREGLDRLAAQIRLDAAQQIEEHVLRQPVAAHGVGERDADRMRRATFVDRGELVAPALEQLAAIARARPGRRRCRRPGGRRRRSRAARGAAASAASRTPRRSSSRCAGPPRRSAGGQRAARDRGVRPPSANS